MLARDAGFSSQDLHYLGLEALQVNAMLSHVRSQYVNRKMLTGTVLGANKLCEGPRGANYVLYPGSTVQAAYNGACYRNKSSFFQRR